MFDVDSQKHGIIAINDYSQVDFPRLLASRSRKLNAIEERRRTAMLKLLTKGMPLRFKEMHLLHVPWYIEWPSRGALAFLPKKMRSKLHFSTWSHVHSSLVSQEHLPSDMGGAHDAPPVHLFASARFEGYINDLDKGCRVGALAEEAGRAGEEEWEAKRKGERDKRAAPMLAALRGPRCGTELEEQLHLQMQLSSSRNTTTTTTTSEHAAATTADAGMTPNTAQPAPVPVGEEEAGGVRAWLGRFFSRRRGGDSGDRKEREADVSPETELEISPETEQAAAAAVGKSSPCCPPSPRTPSPQKTPYPATIH
jgi:hypothetical protein